ncbi:MAG: hypothetical protein OXC62_03845 [Aestuariivita sp.]|nr:hypothetical protein [Aestuariivita sp.]
MSTSGVTVTAPEVTWNQVLARLGNRQAPTNSIVSANVFVANTNTSVGNGDGVAVISSSSPIYAGRSVARTDLAAKTLYFIERG